MHSSSLPRRQRAEQLIGGRTSYMESEKLRLLLKTVELGSLSRAATAMGYTQSAASYAIQSLEEELGVTMLHRSRPRRAAGPTARS